MHPADDPDKWLRATGKDLYQEAIRAMTNRDYDRAHLFSQLAQTYYMGEMAGALPPQRFLTAHRG